MHPPWGIEEQYGRFFFFLLFVVRELELMQKCRKHGNSLAYSSPIPIASSLSLMLFGIEQNGSDVASKLYHGRLYRMCGRE